MPWKEEEKRGEQAGMQAPMWPLQMSCHLRTRAVCYTNSLSNSRVNVKPGDRCGCGYPRNVFSRAALSITCGTPESLQRGAGVPHRLAIADSWHDF